MNEKTYKRIRNGAAASLACGIVTVVSGIACGILMIVTGAMLMKAKSETLF